MGKPKFVQKYYTDEEIALLPPSLRPKPRSWDAMPKRSPASRRDEAERHKVRWQKLPPELHARADRMLLEALRRYPAEKHWYMKGLLAGNITHHLLRDKSKVTGQNLCFIRLGHIGIARKRLREKSEPTKKFESKSRNLDVG